MEGSIHPSIQGEKAHIMMMRSPDHWPDTGVSIVVVSAEGVDGATLPKPSALLALTNGKRLGVMTSRPEYRFSVFEVILYDRRLPEYLASGDPGDMPRHDYASAEEAFIHGWRVD